jgi:hypothetical protein
MPSTILELPSVEKLASGAEDEFELDLRVVTYEPTRQAHPQMCQSGTCGCNTSANYSCYGTCTVENCGGNTTSLTMTVRLTCQPGRQKQADPLRQEQPLDRLLAT